jgi:anti-repressor protein
MDKTQLELLKKAHETMSLMAQEIERMQDEIKEKNQELSTWNRVIQSDDEFDMSEVAKVINYKGYGRTKLFEYLRDKSILRNNNHPYQKYVDEGYFRIVEENFTDNYGNERIYLKTVATQKGIDFIKRKLDEYNTPKN